MKVMNLTGRWSVVVLVLMLFCPCVQAQPTNLLINGSFEDGPAMGADNVAINNGDLPGWTHVDSFSWYMRNGSWGVARNGLRFIETGYPISQSFAVQAGMSYQVSYYEGLRQDGNGQPDTLSAGIALAAGSASGTTNQIADNPNGVSTIGAWQRYSFCFTPDQTTTATLTFQTASGVGYPVLDDVSVVALSSPSSTQAWVEVANSTNGFSDVQGSNGWYYGYYQDDVLGGTFVQLPYLITSTPANGPWWANGTVWDQWPAVSPVVWGAGGHPGYPSLSPVYSVRRWVSTVSGSISISGEWGDGDGSGGNGATCSVRLNGTMLTSRSFANEGAVLRYRVSTAVRVGDTIDFVIDPNGEYSGDSTYFTAVIRRAAPPDLSAWACGTKLTFSGYDKEETLTNFPALVILGTNVQGFSYGQFAFPAGEDLRFVDADTNELSYEIDTWNTNGASYVWVRVPALTNNAAIWAYWGNTNAGMPDYGLDGSTWVNGYAGVWHMTEPNARDSTANHNDGTAAGGVTATNGLADGADDLDGSTGTIHVPRSSSLDITGPVTIETWLRIDSEPWDVDQGLRYPIVFGKMHDYQGYSFFWLDGVGVTPTLGTGGAPWVFAPSHMPSVGEWYHYVAVYDGSYFRLYVNGQEWGTPTANTLNPTAADRYVVFGEHYQFPGTYGHMDGRYDESRISQLGRSPNWIWATWFNAASNSDFVSLSPVESSSGAPRIRTDPATGIGATGATLNGYLSSTGSAETAVLVYWGTTDEGTNNTWAHSAQFPGVAAVGAFSTNVTLSPSGVTYFYRYCATSTNAVVWADSSASFLAGEITIAASTPAASEVGPVSGTFTVTRPAGGTNGALTVNYTIDGSASNGVDYAALNGAVTLPAGESNTTITVTPIADFFMEGTETVRVALAGGTYVVGSPSQAEVTIADAPFTPVVATGGVLTETNGYRIHTFSGVGSTSLVVTTGGYVDILVVAGGGGGGCTIAGGGGAGGLVYTNSYALFAGTNTVIVGAGGPGSPTSAWRSGTKGDDSSFVGLIALGGGGGGGWSSGAGTSGGSGGGGADSGGGGSGTGGQGTAGGASSGNPAGGGGGAFSGGGNGSGDGTRSGAGGAGAAYDISGATTYYGGGGGGGAGNGAAAGAGGNGGGGAGGSAAGGDASLGANGVDGTGGGGGGGGFDGVTGYGGGTGGCGVVIVRYAIPQRPVITNASATDLTTASATLNGRLVSIGLVPTAVSVYWGPSDGGTNAGDWANTNVFAGEAVVGTFSTNVTFGSANATYYYRYYASNSVGGTWADPAATFIAEAVTVQATDASAAYPGDTGVFTVSRPAAATNEALTIYYTLGGTATNGADYAPMTTSVVLNAGIAVTNIVVTPVDQVFRQGTCDVVLTLAGGSYLVGSANSATVTIVQAGSLATWNKRMPILFSGYTRGETLTNFPVLVVFSNGMAGGNFLYSDFLSPPYGDLRFAASERGPLLNYEVESWDPNGLSYVWVEVPALAGTNTSIWVSWNKAGVVASPCTTNGATWTQDFLGVWHMGEIDALDSARRGHDGTAAGTAANTNGLIGRANVLSQYGDHIFVPGSADFAPAGDYSMSMWVYLRPNADYEGLMGTYDGTGFIWPLLSGLPKTPTFYTSTGNWQYGDQAVVTPGRWHLLGYTRQGGTGKHYVNGVCVQTDVGFAIPGGGDLYLGKGGSAWGYWLDGIMDEVRFEGATRSPDWIWACWLNQASNAQFSAVGSIVSRVPIIANSAATAVGATSATLNGYLSDTGAAPTTVYVYWGLADAGTNKNAWDTTIEFAGAASVSGYSTNVTFGVPNATYCYRYSASNAFGETWATPVSTFMPGAVTIQATDPGAAESGDTGTFTVYRPGTATNEALTVNYTVGGTASNGVDYLWLGGTVTLAAGESNAMITVTPILDGETEGPETVRLTLATGPYLIGSPSNADVTIADAAPALTNTWSGTGYWTNTANWSCGFVPVGAQVAEVPAGSVILDAPTVPLAGFVIGNATLTFANFSGTATNTLSATDVVIRNGAVITHATNTDINAGDGWQVDGAVVVMCSNLTVEAGGQINVDARGFTGGFHAQHAMAGNGPGGGGVADSGAGAGYGGAGGAGMSIAGGVTNGTASDPEYPGSGGGGFQGGVIAGNGGGLVRIVASGDVTVDGVISADGYGYVNHGMAGAGSGGGVSIRCNRFMGSGAIRAQGGLPTIYWSGAWGGAGGGGRIAVNYDTTAQQSVGTQPTVTFSLSGNRGKSEGRPGTLCLPDTQFFPTPDLHLENGEIIIPGFTAWAPSHLTISNGLAVFPSGLHLTVSNNLVTAGFKGGLELSGGRVDVLGSMDLYGTNYSGADLTFDGAKSAFIGTPVSVGSNLTLSGPGSAVLIMSYSNLTVGGSALLTNSAILRLYASPTNSPLPGYGQLFSVGGKLTVAPDAHIMPYSDPVNGGSVKFSLKGLTVDAGGEINADGKGYAGGVAAAGKGPGGGGQVSVYVPGGGGGYGGRGGTDASGAWGGVGGVGGAMYGSSNALPFHPGSGGAGGPGIGGNGGGLVWIDAPNGIVTLDGLISANGAPAAAHGMAAHGAGGGIYITCRRFAGNGLLTANGAGGSGWVGGVGGGGRIAIWRQRHTFTGMASATNGANTAVGGTVYGMDGVQAGTIFWGDNTPPGMVITIR